AQAPELRLVALGGIGDRAVTQQRREVIGWVHGVWAHEVSARRSVRKEAAVVRANSPSGRSGSLVKLCHIPSQTSRRTSQPAWRRCQYRRVLSLSSRSRVPVTSIIGGSPGGTGADSGETSGWFRSRSPTYRRRTAMSWRRDRSTG